MTKQSTISLAHAKNSLLVTLFFAVPWHAFAQEAHEAHAEAAEKGGLPQLDAAFYPSQIFWLAVTAILMYAIMAKFALPRVAHFIDQRDDKVRHDLEQAARLRQEAEDVKVMYSRNLRDADERSRALVDRVVREIKDKQTQDLAHSMERINADIDKTEQRLHNEKNAVLADVSQIARELSGKIVEQLGKQAG